MRSRRPSSGSDRPRRPLPAPPGGSGRRRSPRRSARSTSSSARARSAPIGTSNYSAAQLEEAGVARAGGVRLGAERVLVARARGRARAPAGLRAPRARVHPVLPARERPADRQVPARRARAGGHAPRTGARSSDEEHDRVEALEAFAAERGVSLLEVAIGGLAAQPPVVSVIAGATRPEQVRANAAAGDWEPSPGDLAALSAIA